MPNCSTPTYVSESHAEQLAQQTENAALKGRYARAERFARELLEVVIILHGPQHLEVGIAQFYLALALEEQGKTAEAVRVRKQARRILLSQGCLRN